MAKNVKPTRRYDSKRRLEQAQETRRAILAAAKARFEEHGYAATTVAEIATDAGVATKTVYLAFDSKGGVLRALWNLLLRGEQDDRPVADQEWYREVLDERDPERQLRLNARNSAQGKQRISSILEVIRSAASADARDRRALAAHPERLPREPARDRRAAREAQGALPRSEHRTRGRHPLDDQPSEHVAAARRPARAGRLSSTSSGRATRPAGTSGPPEQGLACTREVCKDASRDHSSIAHLTCVDP